MRARWMAHLLVAAAAVRALAAQPADVEELPPGLRDWVPWVLAATPDTQCTSSNGVGVCCWPGRLRLSAGDAGADFSLVVEVEKRVAVPLPGDGRRWPQGVRADGRPVPVLEHENRPSVWIDPGRHQVAGRLEWASLQDSIPVPPEVALVDLEVRGRPVERPLRAPDGTLTLSQREPGSEEPDRLRVQVSRRVVDGVPIWVDTAITLLVGGRAREVDLRGALVEGAVPISVTGGLPARLLPDGTLRVQVRPGAFTVEVRVVLEGSPGSLKAPEGALPWPEQEIWAVQRDDAFRELEVGGARPVDGRYVEIHAPWRDLPAFRLGAGESLTLRSLRRGLGEAGPGRLKVRRNLWLSLDGRSFKVAEHVDASGSRLTRLSMRSPAVPGRVAVGEQPQLLTSDPVTGLPGVELRGQQSTVYAESKLPRTLHLPVVGWDTDVDDLTLQLALPPGWRLLAAPGADSAPNAWITGWNLGGVLVVGLGVILAARLWGRRWGLVAGAVLALLWGETGAPILWVLVWLAAALLVRVPAQGGWRRLTRGVWLASAAVAVATGAAFGLDHLAAALNPQLTEEDSVVMGKMATTGAGGLGAVSAPVTWRSGTRLGIGGLLHEPPVLARRLVGAFVEPVARVSDPPMGALMQAAPPAPPRPAAAPRAAGMPAVEGAYGGVPTAPSYPAPTPTPPRPPAPARPLLDDVDPDDLLQAGWGLPSWKWSLDYLTWRGKVPADQKVWLLLAPPWLNLLLAVARVALLAVLGRRLARSSRLPAPAAVAAGALLVTVLLGVARPGAAEAPAAGFPAPAMLEELRQRLERQRLLEPAPCEPACVSTARLHLGAAGRTLHVTAEVHAGAPSTWSMPGPAQGWLPSEVLLDGVRTSAMARMPDGFLALRLPAGVHRVEAVGPLPSGPSLTLQFPEEPHFVTVAAPGWQVDGLREDGSCSGSLQLSRREAAGQARTEEMPLRPFFRVRREITLGLRWRVWTTVERLGVRDAPAVLAVPPVAGSMATSEQRLPDGRVVLTFERGVSQAGFDADLAAADGTRIELEAPEHQPWVEEWVVRPGALWRCRIEGPPPVRDTDGAVLAYTFRPWPGERLQVTVTRARGVPGSTTAVRAAKVITTARERGAEASLRLQVAATRAGELGVRLPAGARIQELRSSSRVLSPRLRDGAVVVPVDAGDQAVDLRWQEARRAGWWIPASMVRLDLPVANVLTSLSIPRQRWLLWVGGPSWGPAVPWWSRLALLLALAWCLAGWPGPPLGRRDWLLLAAGLSILPVIAAVPVAAVPLLLTRWRGRGGGATRWKVGLGQLGVLLAGLVALAALAAVAWVGVDPDGAPTDLLTGNSGMTLRWVADELESGSTPKAAVLVPPAWVLRVLVLVWAAWVVRRLRAWLPWAWECFALGSGWQLDPVDRWKVVVPRTESAEPGSILGLDLGGPEPPSTTDAPDAAARVEDE